MKWLVWIFTLAVFLVPQVKADSTYVLDSEIKKQTQEITSLVENWNRSFEQYETKLQERLKAINSKGLSVKEKKLAKLKFVHSQAKMLVIAAKEYQLTKALVLRRVKKLNESIIQEQLKRKNESTRANIEVLVQKIDIDKVKASDVEKQAIKLIINQNKYSQQKMDKFNGAKQVALKQMKDFNLLKEMVLDQIDDARSSIG